jgi:hypothetical protein
MASGVARSWLSIANPKYQKYAKYQIKQRRAQVHNLDSPKPTRT